MHKIIFIDDDPALLNGLRRMLRHAVPDWQLTFSETPQAARTEFESSDFDVAVVDVNMPGQSGLELLQQIKNNKRTANCQVVVLTGLDDASLKRKALDAGAADLLTKPVSREDLLARITNAAKMKSVLDELQEKKQTTGKRSSSLAKNGAYRRTCFRCCS